MLVSERQRKMEDTKQRILEKSLELFSTKGYDAVSMGAVSYTHLDVYKRQHLHRRPPAPGGGTGAA